MPCLILYNKSASWPHRSPLGENRLGITWRNNKASKSLRASTQTCRLCSSNNHITIRGKRKWNSFWRRKHRQESQRKPFTDIAHRIICCGRPSPLADVFYHLRKEPVSANTTIQGRSAVLILGCPLIRWFVEKQDVFEARLTFKAGQCYAALIGHPLIDKRFWWGFAGIWWAAGWAP